MRLISLRLLNFRQHADTRLTFERGLTGIIGPNGAGKSTLLEAIAWALYGNSAARGTRDSIRFAGAEPRSSVRVELEFELAAHRYKVVRGLTAAECFLDDAETPIASTITGVNELVQRRLGMTRSEFFHTYFTGQKELDVMAAMGPSDRAKFLSRVLGYDRITGAQELVRERRRTLVAESNGLKQGMPDRDVVLQQLQVAEASVRSTRARSLEVAESQTRAVELFAELAPRFSHARTEREHAQQLLAELRVVENDVIAHTRDLERLTQELNAIAQAARELEPLGADLATLPQTRERVRDMDQLAANEATRQALLERERSLIEDELRLADRAAKLESAPSLEIETQQLLTTARASLHTVEQSLEHERTSWVRDRQEAETRLESLRVQYTDLADQRDKLEGLGEESPCPTCGRPLGASYRGVLELIMEQVETVRIDGNYYRQRVDQLAKPPVLVETLEEQRRTATQELAGIERRMIRIQTALAERVTIAAQRAEVAQRLLETRTSLSALATGYDATVHAQLRAELTRLGDVGARAARLNALMERAPLRRDELARAEAARAKAQERAQLLSEQRALLHTDDSAFASLRTLHDDAESTVRRLELEVVTVAADSERAHREHRAAQSAQQELERLQTSLTLLDNDRRMHDELDRAFTDLRTDLNFQLRPELAEIAGGFLDELTDGRYSALEFDEDYNLIVLEDQVPKTVISGGEEDLCNLVLRLAISQMIAERAGQAFSLLILDEVFGSLDDTRRGNVMDLLRRLNDRFEQVIVITHIEQVREGVDRVLVVRLDEDSGASVVTSGTELVAQ